MMNRGRFMDLVGSLPSPVDIPLTRYVGLTHWERECVAEPSRAADFVALKASTRLPGHSPVAWCPRHTQAVGRLGAWRRRQLPVSWDRWARRD